MPAASDGSLRLGTYRPLWAAKEVDLSPALQFIRARQVAELSPSDADALGIGEGDRVEVGNGTRVKATAQAARRDPGRQRVPRRGHARGRLRTCSPAASSRCTGSAPGSTDPSAVARPGPARRRGPGRDAAVGRAADPAAGGHMSVLAEVGYYEPWWMQILKAHRDLRRRLPDRADRAARRAQGARPLPAPLRAQPGRPVRRDAADRRHRQAPVQGAVPPADVERLAVRGRAR